MSDTATIATPLTAKDFVTDQEVRWCPGCGDYSILAQVQKVMPTLGIPKENIVIVSGIGCSSRFPYYMNTYGMHSIHGAGNCRSQWLKGGKTGIECVGSNRRWRQLEHWRQPYHSFAAAGILTSIFYCSTTRFMV